MATFAPLKKITAILFLVVFLVQAGGSLSILAAFKMNQKYIAENLCINRFELIPVCKGSCVLEEQLNDHKAQQEKMPDLKIKEIQLICNQYQVEIFPIQILITETYHTPANTDFYTQDYTNRLLKPPAIIV